MPSLTEKEKEALLILFKDFTTFYNANSLSKILDITRIGTMKLLRRLKKEDILTSIKIGKAMIYKINLKNDYSRKLIAFLLADEANKYKRWKEEFKELENNIILLYGSILSNYKKARDIDILLVLNKEDKEVTYILNNKQKLLPKKIHSLMLTAEDLAENIKNREGATLEIIKTSIVLYQQKEYVDIINKVQEFTYDTSI